MKTDLRSMLDAREMRYRRQRELLARFGCTLISYTLNTPGEVKQNERLMQVHDIGMGLLRGSFSSDEILFMDVMHPDTGSEGYLCIDREAWEVKRITCMLENRSILGRIFDIDVFDMGGKSVSRTDIGYPPRRCLLCDGDAKTCIKERKHSQEDIRSAFEGLVAQH